MFISHWEIYFQPVQPKWRSYFNFYPLLLDVVTVTMQWKDRLGQDTAASGAGEAVFSVVVWWIIQANSGVVWGPELWKWEIFPPSVSSSLGIFIWVTLHSLQLQISCNLALIMSLFLWVLFLAEGGFLRALLSGSEQRLQWNLSTEGRLKGRRWKQYEGNQPEIWAVANSH